MGLGPTILAGARLRFRIVGSQASLLVRAVEPASAAATRFGHDGTARAAGR